MGEKNGVGVVWWYKEDGHERIAEGLSDDREERESKELVPRRFCFVILLLPPIDPGGNRKETDEKDSCAGAQSWVTYYRCSLEVIPLPYKIFTVSCCYGKFYRIKPSGFRSIWLGLRSSSLAV